MFKHHLPHHHGGPPPHPHEGYPPPPPPHHNHYDEGRDWYAPLPDETDLAILEEILEDADLARAVFRVFTSSPPEVAAVGVLGLREFKRLESRLSSLFERLDSLESRASKEEGGNGTP